MKNELMKDRIDTTTTVQLTSKDGKVRIAYYPNDLGMKYRVQVDIGSRRSRWQVVGYSDTYYKALKTFNRIVSDRERAFDFGRK